MCAAIAMRTTADLPDELHRRAKAEAAVRGCNFNDLVEERLLRVLRVPTRDLRSGRPAGPSVDGDPAGFGPIGKGRLSRLEGVLLSAHEQIKFDANSLGILTKRG